MAWFSAGVLTNPSTDTILADSTQPAVNGRYRVVMGGATAVIAAVEWRNVANTANNGSQVIASPANSAIEMIFSGMTWTPGERLRVRLVSPSSLSIQATIMDA